MIPLTKGKIVIGATRFFYGGLDAVITIPNTKDIADIATSAQTITWEKYAANTVYNWDRFTFTTTYAGLELLATVGDMTLDCYRNTSSNLYYSNCYAFTSYAIDYNTGMITLSNGVQAQEMWDSSTGKFHSTVLENAYFTNSVDTATYAATRNAEAVYMADSIGVSNYSSTTASAAGVRQYRAGRIYTKGNKVDSVTSSTSTTYPVDGVSESYYYVKTDTTYTKGAYIEDVTSRVSSAYPADGYQDGYYYVLKVTSS